MNYQNWNQVNRLYYKCLSTSNKYNSQELTKRVSCSARQSHKLITKKGNGMQMKLFSLIILVSTVLISLTSICYSRDKEMVVLKQDLDSVINGIDIEKGELKPGSPQAEKQAVMSNGITGFSRLNVDLSKVISQIGAFEFSSFTEFIDRNNIVVLKDNLRKYGNAKKHYFDRMDDLLKRYRGQLGYGSDITERLGGTVYQFIEKLENIYIADLGKFYDFVLQNHGKMEFSGDQVYFESDKMVEEFDKLWNKTVASTTELTTAQAVAAEIMTNAINEVKDEPNGKSKE